MKITSAALAVRTIALLLVGFAFSVRPVRAQGWTNVDVGSVSAAGSFAWGSTEYVVRGSGADIWGTSDEFHYIYYGWTGDGTFTVRVTGMTNTHTWAKAGIMLRENLTPGSRHVMVAANPGNAVGLFARTTTGGPTDFTLGIYEIPQMWLRLVRSGNTFTGFQSADGNTWYQMGAPVTVALPLTVHAGFAVTSHVDGVLCSATLTNYNFAGTPEYPTPPRAPTGLTATATSPTTVELRWTDNSNNEAEFTVGRSTDNTSFAGLARLPANTTSYVDTSAAPGTTYYYRVAAFAGGAGANSNTVTLTTPSSSPTLTAPTGVTATARSSLQIELTWDTYSPGSARFEIERSRGGAAFTRVATTDAVFSRIWDGGLDAETTYQYRIRAVDTSTGAVSGYSAAASATTMVVPPLANLRLSAASSTELSAAWDYPPSGSQETPTSHLERSADGISFTEIAQGSFTTFADRILSPATRYYYRVRGSRVNSGTGSRNYSAYSPVVSATTQTPPPPPSGTFASADIGAVGAAGSTGIANGVYTVRGAGEDVFGPSDEFHYHYRSWTGDGVFTVRVTNVEYTFNWAKAGIMIRSALTDNAQHAYAFISPELNHALVYRTTTGGSTTAPGAVDSRQKAMPMWLRLTRAGNSVAMDYSFDGVGWVRRDATSISFPSTVWVGLAVNSHVDARLCTSTFDNLALDTIYPTALRVIPRSATRVYVTWQDNDIDETGFEIERSTDNVTFALVGTAPAWQLAGWSKTVVPPQAPPSFTDTTASPSTTYYYRVRSITPRGPSRYSTAVSATTPPPPPPGWNSLDIGDTALTGTASASGGVFTIRGAGSGVGSVRYYRESAFKGDYGSNVTGYSDEFQYCWQPWSGDGEMVARVTGFSGAATGHAGIMVRVGSEANAYNVFCHLKQTGGVGVMARPRVTSGIGENFSYETRVYYASPAATAPPTWLKIVRLSNGVMCYSSPDGTTWTEIAWIGTSGWPADVQFGLAVSSLEDGNPPALPALLTTTFDNVAIRNITTPVAPPLPPTNIRATYTAQTYITLAWDAPASTYELPRIEVERSLDGSAFTVVNAFAISPWTDTSLTANTPYYYRLRSLRGGMYSSYSPTLLVRTPDYPTAPTNLIATVVSSTQVRLDWTDTSSSESGFTILRSTDNSTFQPWISVGADVTTYTVQGLTAGVTYYFRVEASPSRPSGPPAVSNTASATPGSSSAPAAPSSLTASAVSPTRVDLAWTDNSTDETSFQLERSTDNTTFSTSVTLPANTTQHSDTTVNGGTTYYYRVRALSGGPASGYSNTASVTTPGTPPTGLLWQSRDIGDIAAAGTTSESGGTVTMRASGADIWNTADGFRYRYQAWSGDGEIIARVIGLTNTNGWAKAGVMFRESLTANSRHASMIVSIAHGTAFQYRTATGGESGSSLPSEAGGIPQWVRLVRAGNTFTGYSSLDGVTWIQAGSITLALPATIQVGLAVTSHNDGVLCTATFENFSLTGGGAPPATPPNPPDNLTATATSASQINLAWTDSSTNESGFEVESSTDNTTFTRLTTTTANATSYAHTGLSGATTYYYRIRAVNSAGASSYTAVTSATTPAAPPPPTGGTWTSAEIGGVAAAGRTDETSTGVMLTGSGADIWNTADEFRYRYQSWTGDGEIVTRVSTLTNTHGWAKAGVMFRETLEPNSRHAWMCVSIAHGTAFQYRNATGGESGSAPPSESGSVPRWLRLVRSGNTFTGYASDDGASWTQAGTITLELPATILIGIAVTSHNDGVLCTATFENTAVTGGGTPPPPPPPTSSWEFRDIGAVGIAGSNTSSGNTITVNASGADIWDTSDAFRFVYRAVPGDFTVEAQVSSLSNTHAWAKAGVMIRESTAANAQNVFAFVTPSNGVVAQQRASSGATTAAASGPWWATAPYWVRLVRAGARITAFASPDGSNWTQFAAYDATMGATVQVGFALTSHNNAQLGSAMFVDPLIR